MVTGFKCHIRALKASTHPHFQFILFCFPFLNTVNV